jgi:hypothetical protein
MDALYRGDMKSRYEAYQLGVQTWLLRNEIRAAEGKNPIDGFDEPIMPVNMETQSQAQARSDANTATAQAKNGETDSEEIAGGPGSGGAETPEPGPEDDEQKALEQTRLRAHVLNAAGRIVRREAKTLRKMASNSAADATSFHIEAQEFYRDLTPLVVETMLMPAKAAEQYCVKHLAAIAEANASFDRRHLLDMAFDRIEDGELALAGLALKARCITA